MRNLIFCLFMVAVGCSSKPADTAVYNIGKFKEVRAMPTSFNESMKSMVVTEKGCFSVRGYASGILSDKECYMKGKRIFILQPDENWVSWELIESR